MKAELLALAAELRELATKREAGAGAMLRDAATEAYGEASAYSDAAERIESLAAKAGEGGGIASEIRAEIDRMDALIEAYNQWPADIRKKLSLHDLRRMSGWTPPTPTPAAQPEGVTEARALLERAEPLLRDAAEPYEDDGSNEPLELARDIAEFLAAAGPVERPVSSASAGFDGLAVATKPAKVPEGYVLVPVEPTEAMRTAHEMYGDTSDWWQAVITAAQQEATPPGAKGGGVMEIEEENLIIADGFESAFIGVAYPWQNGNKPVAVYDKEACIMHLMEQMECEHDEALEYFEFNVEGAYVGEQTPIFVSSDPRNANVEVFGHEQ